MPERKLTGRNNFQIIEITYIPIPISMPLDPEPGGHARGVLINLHYHTNGIVVHWYRFFRKPILNGDSTINSN